MIKFQPYNDFILLQKVIKEKKPNAIITIHEIDNNEPVYQVISVGSEVNKNSLDDFLIIIKNTLVYISKYGTQSIKIDNQDFVLAKREQILGFA
jgi:co-chaperonin GroES (HSP10)